CELESRNILISSSRNEKRGFYINLVQRQTIGISLVRCRHAFPGGGRGKFKRTHGLLCGYRQIVEIAQGYLCKTRLQSVGIGQYAFYAFLYFIGICVAASGDRFSVRLPIYQHQLFVPRSGDRRKNIQLQKDKRDDYYEYYGHHPQQKTMQYSHTRKSFAGYAIS